MNFQCCNCKIDFDLKQKTPHILIKCGHSICKLCLDQNLIQNKNTICQIDNKVYEIEDIKINKPPKNYAIIQYLEQKESQSSSYECSNEVHKSIFSKEESKENQAKDSVNNTFVQNTELNTEKNESSLSDFLEDTDCERQQTICNVHGIQNNVYCQTCESQICHNCGLFGSHKLHNFVSNSELQEQAKQVSKEFQKVYESLKKCKLFLKNHGPITYLNQTTKKHKDILRGHIIQHFEKQVRDIRQKEKDSLILLNQQISKFEAQLEQKIILTQERLEQSIQNRLKDIKELQKDLKISNSDSLNKIQKNASKNKLPQYRTFAIQMQRFEDISQIQIEDIVGQIKAQSQKQKKYEIIQIWQPSNEQFIHFLENYGKFNKNQSQEDEESLLTLGKNQSYIQDSAFGSQQQSKTDSQDKSQKQIINQILEQKDENNDKCLKSYFKFDTFKNKEKTQKNIEKIKRERKASSRKKLVLIKCQVQRKQKKKSLSNKINKFHQKIKTISRNKIQDKRITSMKRFHFYNTDEKKSDLQNNQKQQKIDKQFSFYDYMLMFIFQINYINTIKVIQNPQNCLRINILWPFLIIYCSYQY